MAEEHRHDYVIASRWCRFSDYQLVGGAIRPAPGADLAWFDPWDEYRIARDGSEQRATPDQALLDLDRELSFAVDDDAMTYALSGSGKAAVLQFCRRFGLMGLLHHRLREVRFPEAHGWQRIYRRVPRGWESRREPAGLPTLRLSPLGLVRDDPTQEDAATWNTYFGFQGAGWGPAPLIGTAASWRQYQEPVAQFVGAVSAFAEVARGLAHMGSGDPLAGAALDRLNELLGDVEVAVEWSAERGRVQERWVARSFLSACGLMLTRHTTAGSGIVECAGCGRLITERLRKARYCSTTCARRVQTRRYRAARRQREPDAPAED